MLTQNSKEFSVVKSPAVQNSVMEKISSQNLQITEMPVQFSVDKVQAMKMKENDMMTPVKTHREKSVDKGP